MMVAPEGLEACSAFACMHISRDVPNVLQAEQLHAYMSAAGVAGLCPGISPAAYFLSCTSSVMFLTTVNLGQSRSWQNHGLSSLAGVWLAGLAASAAEAAHSSSRHSTCFIVNDFNL
jgi:hypothetical protein